MYFFNIIDIRTAKLVKSKASRESTCDEAMRVSEEIEKQVIEEDDVDEGFLVPVKNIWIVDKLRAERDEAINERDETTQKLDEAIKERDEERAKIAELKRQLGED